MKVLPHLWGLFLLQKSIKWAVNGLHLFVYCDFSFPFFLLVIHGRKVKKVLLSSPLFACNVIKRL